MSNIDSRLKKLEAKQPRAGDLSMAKPSEILARANELIQAGAQPIDEQRRALDSIRQATAASADLSDAK